MEFIRILIILNSSIVNVGESWKNVIYLVLYTNPIVHMLKNNKRVYRLVILFGLSIM